MKKMSDTAEPPVGFLHLPSELRNEIYHLILLHQDPIDPWLRGRFRREQELTPGLLCASNVIHREASSLFYSTNCFDLSDATYKQIVELFGQIGQVNAGYIRHVRIAFPEFPQLSAGHPTLGQESVRLLALLQERCPNLTTLNTSLDSTSHMEVRMIELEIKEKHELEAQALQQVDDHFRAISTLQEIIIEVYEHDEEEEEDEDLSTDHIRQIMKSHGWTVITTEGDEDDWEDWDEGLDDLDDDDYDYDYDYEHGYDDGYGDDGYVYDDDDDGDDDIDDY
ncbi:hypothetical protein F4679DRAFT_555080 [Xylaria curta]|nr:hypothetical protein F4679DRAFT_555080 [Xylaria curta]